MGVASCVVIHIYFINTDISRFDVDGSGKSVAGNRKCTLCYFFLLYEYTSHEDFWLVCSIVMVDIQYSYDEYRLAHFHCSSVGCGNSWADTRLC